MSALQGYRFFVIVGVLAALAACATNRILKCEGHLVPINPPPPKRALAAPAPAQKSLSPRSTEHKP